MKFSGQHEPIFFKSNETYVYLEFPKGLKNAVFWCLKYTSNQIPFKGFHWVTCFHSNIQLTKMWLAIRASSAFSSSSFVSRTQCLVACVFTNVCWNKVVVIKVWLTRKDVSANRWSSGDPKQRLQIPLSTLLDLTQHT